MPNRSKLLASGLLVAVAVAAPATANRPQEAKDTTPEDVEHECGDDTVTLTADLALWPPNHKYSPLTVVAEADDAEQVTLDTQVTHDEVAEDGTEERGAGNTADDADPPADMDEGQGSATTEHEVRSERSGRGDGRTYTIMYEATFNENMCTGEFAIEVPHDMRSDKAPPKQDKTG